MNARTGELLMKVHSALSYNLGLVLRNKRRRRIGTASWIVLAASVVLATAKPVDAARSPDGIWEDVSEAAIAGGTRWVVPSSYRAVRLDVALLQAKLAQAPMEFTPAANNSALEMSFPLPDGRFVRFRVVESPIMEKGLASKFPEVKTYSGIGVDDPTQLIRFMVSLSGFYAFLSGSEGGVKMAPAGTGDAAECISYYVKDDPEERLGRCLVQEVDTEAPGPVVPANFSRGSDLRTYVLAAAATVEYTNANGGTVQSALNQIKANVNAVNLIYQRDMSIRLTSLEKRNGDGTWRRSIAIPSNANSSSGMRLYE